MTKVGVMTKVDASLADQAAMAFLLALLLGNNHHCMSNNHLISNMIPRFPSRCLMLCFVLCRESTEAMIGVKVGALTSLEDDGIRCLDDQLKAALNRDYPGWEFPSQTWMVPNAFEMKESREKRGQLAEEKIFNLLYEFGNNRKEKMFVVHLYNFKEKIKNWQNLKFDEKKYVIGEHDFVLIHRHHGVIFLQVKSGTKCKSFGEANSQLEKDKVSIKFFAKEKLNGELKKKMNKELHGEQHAYVVMPELERGNSPHGSKGIFKEDCENVGAFSQWWDDNILPRTHPDQEVYNCLVMR